MTEAAGGDPPAPAAVDLIRAKRDGRTLTGAEIRWLIAAYVRGEVADEQMSALLMAIFFRGLQPGELRAWTAAMIASGERLDLSGVRRPTVDKHSTGGVGDKVSLILAPLVAACGAAVPQLSGRGLGHTGGTLDKLEAIPGWRATLSPAEMIAALRSVGCVICAAGSGLAPADRKLYALRDVTGTVESIPLIASSIMSKKIAEGTSALVLDVKVGSGAFMASLDDARELARTMVTLGGEQGVRTSALLTAMDTPLGRAVGNALEVEESAAVLRGAGPADLVQVTLALAAEMLRLAGIDADPAAALADGRALDRYRAMIAEQGGDPDAELPRAAVSAVLTAPETGWLRRLDARAVGVAAWRLGAGRARKEDPVSAGAGVLCLAKPGERVAAGQPVLELRTDDESLLAGARAALAGAIEVGDEPPPEVPLVIERIASFPAGKGDQEPLSDALTGRRREQRHDGPLYQRVVEGHRRHLQRHPGPPVPHRADRRQPAARHLRFLRHTGRAVPAAVRTGAGGGSQPGARRRRNRDVRTPCRKRGRGRAGAARLAAGRPRYRTRLRRRR